MTYREDESRTRGAFCRANQAWLYRFTLSLLKQCQNKNSVAMNRRCCGWNDIILLEILSGYDLVTAGPAEFPLDNDICQTDWCLHEDAT